MAKRNPLAGMGAMFGGNNPTGAGVPSHVFTPPPPEDDSNPHGIALHAALDDALSDRPGEQLPGEGGGPTFGSPPAAPVSLGGSPAVGGVGRPVGLPRLTGPYRPGPDYDPPHPEHVVAPLLAKHMKKLGHKDVKSFIHELTAGGGHTDPRFSVSSKQGLDFKTGLLNEHGGDDGELHMQMNPGEGYHGLVDLQSQGSGRGKELLRNHVDMFKRLGAKHAKLLADIDVGGYAWGRYGYVPEQKDWDDNRAVMKEDFNTFHRHQVSPMVQDEMDKHLGSSDPKSMWNVVDQTSPVDNPLNGAKGQALGKALAIGSVWHGKLDFKDKESMGRFNNYVGPPTPAPLRRK